VHYNIVRKQEGTTNKKVKNFPGFRRQDLGADGFPAERIAEETGNRKKQAKGNVKSVEMRGT